MSTGISLVSLTLFQTFGAVFPPFLPDPPTCRSSLLGLCIVEERVAEQCVASDDEGTNSAETKRQR